MEAWESDSDEKLFECLTNSLSRLSISKISKSEIEKIKPSFSKLDCASPENFPRVAIKMEKKPQGFEGAG